MKFAHLPLDQAEGALLAHGLLLDGQRHAKASRIDADLVQAARKAGLTHLWAARAETGDIPEAEAATRLACWLAGTDLEAGPAVHGRVNLVARQNGLLKVRPEVIHQANALDCAIGIATLAPNQAVSAGELVATIKIIPYAVPGHLISQVEALPAGALSLQKWRSGLTAHLIQSRFPETSPKLLEKTASVTRQRLARLGVHLQEYQPAEPTVHDIPALAAALRAVQSAQPDLILIAGASATCDPQDIIPQAINAAGGTVLRVGMPVDPGNLLVLGRLHATLVLGLPGCARSPKRNGLDLLLEQWAAGGTIDSRMIAQMGVGGLLEGSGQVVPWGWSG